MGLTKTGKITLIRGSSPHKSYVPKPQKNQRRHHLASQTAQGPKVTARRKPQELKIIDGKISFVREMGGALLIRVRGTAAITVRVPGTITTVLLLEQCRGTSGRAVSRTARSHAGALYIEQCAGVTAA